MKYCAFFMLLLCTAPKTSLAQDTFSIVAVDPTTGEVGSAGASCLDNNGFPGSGGARIVSNLLPGKGSINTQAAYNASNQTNARLRMEEGLSPTQIIDWLKANDANGLFGFASRQYGIVDFDDQGQPRSAALTGNSCTNWKGHLTGTNYAIQGNILLGASILDSIEAHFLASTGSLAERLMYALQGGNVVGADTRCFNNGTSSLSAFIRVARPTDSLNNLFLDLNVPSLPAGQEPIDSLQTLFNGWKLTTTLEPKKEKALVFPNPAGSNDVHVQWTGSSPTAFRVYSSQQQLVVEGQLVPGINKLAQLPCKGVYILQILASNRPLTYQKIIVQ